MKIQRLGPVLAIVAVGVLALASRATSAPDEFTASVTATPEAAAAMAGAAGRFVTSLTAEQRSGAVFPFEDAERTRWHFVPGEMHARRGAMIRDMSAAQRSLAHDLLRTALSPGGYTTATAVMELEGILRDLEGSAARFVRDPEQYYFSVFGTPGATGAWAWRVEGHHLSLHFTIADGRWVATAPAFLGSSPAEVRDGPRRGLRVLGDREDAGRALLRSLDSAQRSTAIISADAPNDIVTGANLDLEPLSPVGIRAGDLRADQRELLLTLIDVYAALMTPDLAAARRVAIGEAGIDEITFAWAGGTEPGDRHYYRIQGPTFLVEYDNTQNDANHIHSVWRDFDGDFGRDILREHLSAVGH